MSVLITALFLHLWALWLTKRTRLAPAAAYLFGLLTVVLVCWVGGICDVLFYAALLAFCAIAVLTVVDIVRQRREWLADLKKYLNLATILSIATLVVFTVVYAIQQPRLFYWDEFSFWGYSARLVKMTGQLYTITGIDYVSTYPCGNALLSYLFQFFTSGFHEYMLYLAYAALFIAVFAAAAEVIENAKGSHAMGILVYFGLLLSPFLFAGHWAAADYSTTVYAYASAMADYGLSPAAFAALVLYLAAPKRFYYVAALLFVITVKDTGIMFALLFGAVIVFFQLFLPDKDPMAPVLPKKKRIRQFVVRLIVAGAVLIVPLAFRALWTYHLQQTTDPGNARAQLLGIQGLLQYLFFPSTRSTPYWRILGIMLQEFKTTGTMLLCKDWVLVLVLCLLTVVGMVLAKTWARRLKLMVLQGAMLAGALLYVLSISFYMQGFADEMVEYSRYMSSYYFAWLYAVVLYVLYCAERSRSLQGVLALLIAVLPTYFTAQIGLDHSAFAAPDNAYVSEIAAGDAVVPYEELLCEKDTYVYLVYPDRDTFTWLLYRYLLTPAKIGEGKVEAGRDFSINYRTEEAMKTEKYDYYWVATPQEFADDICENFDYVYVTQPDAAYLEDYAGLFSDGMTPGTLYRTDSGAAYPFTAVEVAP